MKVLALVDAPDHVCCRYRIRAFEPALDAAGISLTIEGLAAGPVARTKQLLRADRFDAVILQRKLLPPWQLGLLHKRAKRLIFDFDDAVLYRDSYDPRGLHCPRRESRFRGIARAADVILAGNDFLADCALKSGARADRVRVLPTCVEPDRYRPSLGSRKAEGLELVWIGSSSTLQGLERRASLWSRLGRQIPGLRLRIVGDRFPDFEGVEVVGVPWSEAVEAEELAKGDVGISWIPDDLWSRGKCGLKVLQYQAAGLPVLANSVGVHLLMIAPGENGFLVETDDDWASALRSLASDVDLRRRQGRAARESVEARYSVAAWGSAFVAAVAGLGTPRGPKVKAVAQRAGIAR